tara:strand:+ start:6675 stop:9296 length:2622 start_codon:yes stop_codon:yes gene_type:complete
MPNQITPHHSPIPFPYLKEIKSLLVSTLLALVIPWEIQAQNFENNAAELGVIHSFSADSEYGAGVSCVDFNLDGLDDITLPSVDSTLFFFQNTGDSFIKLDLIDRVFGEVKSVCWIDFDNDSDLDLSLTEFHGSFFLFENIGDLELVDITDSALLTNESCDNFGHSWVDINNDGLLDIYLNRYFYDTQDCIDYGTENLLFVNNGDNTYTERASEYGISDGNKMSFQSSFYDYDKDGLLDLHIINDRLYENSLYRNTGLGYFEDVSESAGVNLVHDAMTNTIFDFNSDGYHDIYFTNTWPSGSHLLVYNPEDQVYEDQFPNSGAESYIFNWGATPIDYDNDKNIDLAVSGGAGCGTGCNNRLFKNNGELFTQSPYDFNQESAVSYGVAKGDFNSDGFYDLTFLNEAPHNTEVYINEANNKNWLKVNFSGSCSNFFGVGVQYEYFINGETTVNTVFAGSNFLSQDSYTHILGMRNQNSIDSISIHWTSGLTENHYNLSAFQTYDFKEGQTFDTNLNIADSLYICSDEEIEIESTTQYLNTIWNNQENTASIIIDTPGEYYAYLEVEPGVNICSDTILVLLKPEITLNSIATQDPSCFGSEDGSAVITHYDSSGIPIVSTYNDLTDGISTLYLTDNYLCSILVAVELFSPAPLFTEIEVLSKPCDSLDVGSMQVNSFGGTAPYVYSTEDLSTIPFGTNTLATVDSNGCIYPLNFYLDLAPTINIELEITDQILADMGSVEILNNSEVTLIDILNEQNISQQPDSLSAGSYTITYSDENGCEYSELFFVAAINSIGESLIEEFIELYPNPCTSLLHIKSRHSNLTISIYSAQGEELMSEKEFPTSINSLDLTELSSGVYFAQIKKNQEIFTKKIIKN